MRMRIRFADQGVSRIHIEHETVVLVFARVYKTKVNMNPVKVLTHPKRPLSSRSESYHSPGPRVDALESDVRTCVANTGIIHTLTLATMFISDKLHSYPILTVPSLTPQAIPLDDTQRTEEDTDGVSPTNGILRPAEVTRKGGMRVCSRRFLLGNRGGARPARNG